MLKIIVKLRWPGAFSFQIGFVVFTLVIGWFMECPTVDSMTISDSLLKELSLTQKEKISFDRFKSAVYKNLTLDFMKQDLFLLRWIRGKDLDVDRATRDIFTYLEFIEKNKMMTVMEDDWSDLLEDFPFSINNTDRELRPVWCASIGGNNWNIRRGILQGKRARLMRYTYMMFFQLNEKLVDTEKKFPNVTQFSFVMNLDGFNPVNQVCPLCVSSYINLLDAYERFFPGYTHDIIVINGVPCFG